MRIHKAHKTRRHVAILYKFGAQSAAALSLRTRFPTDVHRFQNQAISVRHSQRHSHRVVFRLGREMNKFSFSFEDNTNGATDYDRKNPSRKVSTDAQRYPSEQQQQQQQTTTKAPQKSTTEVPAAQREAFVKLLSEFIRFEIWCSIGECIPSRDK